MKRALLIALLVLTAGCTKPPEGTGNRSGSEDSAEAVGLCGESLRITNGKTCHDLYRSSIALLQLDLGGGQNAICTGTLITPRTIITAAHCSDKTISGMLVGFPEEPDADGKKNFEVHRVTSFKAHPSWDGRPGNPYDVGIVVLDKEISGRRPVPLISVSGHRADSDDVIGIYGFGKNEASEVGILRYGEMILQHLDTGLNYPDDLLGAEFNATQQSICSGDSGGPAALEAHNSFGIVGINSIGTSETCMKDSIAGFANIQIDKNFNFILESKEGPVGVVGDNGVEYF